MEINIEYNFYQEYLNNPSFKNQFETRIVDLKNRYLVNNLTNQQLIKEYFVEIFSWSVLTKKVLDTIVSEMKTIKLTGVIDPCCGNAFHTFLFNTIAGLKTYTVDIQNEKNSWTPILEKEGRLFMKELAIKEHLSNALILSWIDYESLTIDLLNFYNGKIIISIGNYEKLSPKYVEQLKNSFNMSKQIILNMPWGLSEKIEIYIRKNN